MDARLRRVLILDTDPETLIALQHVLEEAGFDVTITWDEGEACQSLGTSRFDFILIGDHPPELDAAAILNGFSFRGTGPTVLILSAIVDENDAEYFRRLGALDVIPKRDPTIVLERVATALAPMQSKATAANSGSLQPRAWRTAS
jgi:DNA-binding response OmpR family regulator